MVESLLVQWYHPLRLTTTLGTGSRMSDAQIHRFPSTCKVWNDWLALVVHQTLYSSNVSFPRTTVVRQRSVRYDAHWTAYIITYIT